LLSFIFNLNQIPKVFILKVIIEVDQGASVLGMHGPLWVNGSTYGL